MTASGTAAPGGAASSDRRKRIVRQVSTMSSHQRAAATVKWTKPSRLLSASPVTRQIHRVAGVEPGGLDRGVEVEGGGDRQRVPGAVGEPRAVAGAHDVIGGDAGEGERHEDRAPVGGEHDGVGGVQPGQSGFGLADVADEVDQLGEPGRLAPLGETPVDPGPEGEVVHRRRRYCAAMNGIVVIGGGICGTAAALMLARDGHEVTLLDRDPGPVPASVDEAWARWERRSVAQMRLAHLMQPAGTRVLEAELPDVVERLDASGALRLNIVEYLLGVFGLDEPRPDDARFTMVTGRRTTVEWVLASVAAEQDRTDRAAGFGRRGADRRPVDRRPASRMSQASAWRAARSSRPTSWSMRAGGDARRRRPCSRSSGSPRCPRRPRTAGSPTTGGSSARPTARCPR